MDEGRSNVVPIDVILARYQQMHADQTLKIVQLGVLLEQRTQERDQALEKLTAADAVPAPWPYEQQAGSELAV